MTLVHDLDAKWLLFKAEGRKRGTVFAFKADMVAHGGDPNDIKHVCMDMSAAYTKGWPRCCPRPGLASTDSMWSSWLSRRWTPHGAKRREQPRVARAVIGRIAKRSKEPVVLVGRVDLDCAYQLVALIGVGRHLVAKLGLAMLLGPARPCPSAGAWRVAQFVQLGYAPGRKIGWF
ncbi:transposase [Massilia sp. CCM 8693]|uniref:Transposase n=1 Tax=Massilia aquatica TaxID=2609000 RepID=A0ABX0MAK1_9BURK|nr:transposase [Massilia aquatica]